MKFDGKTGGAKDAVSLLEGARYRTQPGAVNRNWGCCQGVRLDMLDRQDRATLLDLTPSHTAKLIQLINQISLTKHFCSPRTRHVFARFRKGLTPTSVGH
jgi:hypothetical protein